MNTQTVKAIAGGLGIGSILYFVPFFILKGVLLFLLLAAIFRLFFGRGRYGHYANFHPLFADVIRNMTEEQYSEYKELVKKQSCSGKYNWRKAQHN